MAAPPLHSAVASLPAAADAVLFVHDFAIAGCARGQGLAARLLARVVPA